jgi:hypothetical protein
MAKEKKKYNYTKKTGSPTKYNKKYCIDIIRYFNIDPYKEITEITEYKDGTKKETIKLVACDLPTFEGYSNKINVHVDTLYEWRKIYKDFSVSMTRCKAIQKTILIINGLKGLYQSNFAIFVTSNLTKFSQKKDIQADLKHSGKITQKIEVMSKEEIEKRLKEIDEVVNEPK